MNKHPSYVELLKMSMDDLHGEARAQDMNVRKLRMGVTMGKEKDTAQYRRERKQLARMKTAMTQKLLQQAPFDGAQGKQDKAPEQLKEAKKSDTIPAPTAARKATLGSETEKKTKKSSAI